MEEKMTTTNEKQTTIRLGNRETTWSDLLRDAVSTPGKLLEAYTAFHNFSVLCCPQHRNDYVADGNMYSEIGRIAQGAVFCARRLT